MLCLQDVSDPVTLQAVEVAVRENTSLRKMVISPIKRSKKLNVNEMTCTNVAKAILKGATKNATLWTLRLGVPAEPLPSQQLIPADLRRSKSKLQLLVWAGESPLLVIAHSNGSDFVCVEVLYGTPHGTK